MTKDTLKDSIDSIKFEYLSVNGIYLNKLGVGDSTSFKKHKEYLIALDIYLQILDYCYNIWEELEDVEITQTQISTTIGEAVSCLRTFNTNYYG
jgi:hypothetical protein